MVGGDSLRKALLTILIILAVLAAAGTGAGYLVTNSDKNLPNVYVGNIDVSKMTADETLAALKNGGWENRTAEPLTVTLVNAVDFEIDPVKAGAVLTADEATEKACSYGHDGNIYSNLLKLLKCLSKSTDINDLYRAAGSRANGSYGEKPNEYLSNTIMQGLDWMNEYFGYEEYYIDYEAGVMNVKKGYGQIDFDMEDLRGKIFDALDKGEKKLVYNETTKELTPPDFESINKSFNKDAVDAKYSDDGKFEVIDETDACELDTAKALKMWQDAKIGENIAIPITVTKPQVTGEKLRNQLFADLLGAMTTRFSNSAENRVSNVCLCASKINDYVLYPGDEFSYNTVVGERTEAAGFLPAPAYVGLDAEETVKDEIGGGACQVSSTTYAAVLFAFLEPTDRTCHIYPVNYMQLGIDATVTIPEEGKAVDFKFRNNKNYPVKIKAYTNISEEEKTITVEIWGTLEDTDYMPVEFDASYLWKFDYDRYVETMHPDRPGYKIKLDHDVYTDYGDFGTLTSTQTWRRVYDTDGNLVEEKIVNLPNPATGEPSMDQYHEHTS